MKRSKSISISRERLTYTKIFYGLFILLGMLATFLGRENVVFAQCGSHAVASCHYITGTDIGLCQGWGYDSYISDACERKLVTELKDMHNPDSPNYDSNLEEYGNLAIYLTVDQRHPYANPQNMPVNGAIDYSDLNLDIGIGKGCVLPSESSISKALLKNHEAYEAALVGSGQVYVPEGMAPPSAPLPSGLSTN